jgi:hypothetical protein
MTAVSGPVEGDVGVHAIETDMQARSWSQDRVMPQDCRTSQAGGFGQQAAMRETRISHYTQHDPVPLLGTLIPHSSRSPARFPVAESVSGAENLAAIGLCEIAWANFCPFDRNSLDIEH